jgi:tetratricopeptide (TPR) repeat protein
MKTRFVAVWIAAVACIAVAPAVAKPFVPSGDDVVVERLPEQGDPPLKELKRIRAALARDPRNLDIAAGAARRAIEAARVTGDPRFLGQAQAALTPWWTAADPPSVALLLRATLKQSQHDFDGSIKDLDHLLGREPANGQALLTRATVLTVRGRYADAENDCRKLARRTSALVITACIAGPVSLSGGADDAYRDLVQALVGSGDLPGIRAWGLTLAAEIAARRGDVDAANMHFRDAFALDPRDAYPVLRTPTFCSTMAARATCCRSCTTRRATILCCCASRWRNRRCRTRARRSSSTASTSRRASMRRAPAAYAASTRRGAVPARHRRGRARRARARP